MSREEKLREIAEQEQVLMREIYGFDNGVAWERERIIKLLEADKCDCDPSCDAYEITEKTIALIKGQK